MFLAISILLMHSTMPHEHHSELSAQEHAIEHSQAETLIDLLQLAFHLSPSENHLEDFQKANSSFHSEIYFDRVDHLIMPIQSVAIEPTQPTKQSFLPPKPAPISALDFRGPPQLT